MKNRLSKNDLTPMRRKMLALINRARLGAGCTALSINGNSAAQKHAEDMLDRRYFSHRGKGGSSLRDRYLENGGSWRHGVSENICEDFFPASKRKGRRKGASRAELEELVTRAHEALMGSNPHATNLLAKRNHEVALGFAWNSKRFVVVQLFIERR